MTRSIRSITVPNCMSRYLLTHEAMMSVPPVLPPEWNTMARPIPSKHPASTQAMNNKTTYSLNYRNSDDCIIRHTTTADIPRLKEIFAIARRFMAEAGNPNQWTEGYPSEELLQEDIDSGDSYVIVKGDRIVATFVLRGGADPTYDIIYDGKWPNDKPYATIHRIASSGEATGIMHTALQYALTLYDNIAPAPAVILFPLTSTLPSSSEIRITRPS